MGRVVHHRQTIIDAAVSALDGLTSLTGGATSSRFFAVSIEPAARVSIPVERLEPEERTMSGNVEPRVATLRVRVYASGSDVQREMNAVLDEIEGALPAALAAVSDCAFLVSVSSEIEAEQEQETMASELDYLVSYGTVLGDPSTRV